MTYSKGHRLIPVPPTRDMRIFLETGENPETVRSLILVVTELEDVSIWPDCLRARIGEGVSRDLWAHVMEMTSRTPGVRAVSPSLADPSSAQSVMPQPGRWGKRYGRK